MSKKSISRNRKIVDARFRICCFSSQANKGTFEDGHESEDVVSYRKTLLRHMSSLGFLHPSNAPTEKLRQPALPQDLQCRENLLDKTVLLFHD